MTCLPSSYYVIPSIIWPILPGECIYQEWRILEIAREKSTIQGRKLYNLNLLLTKRFMILSRCLFVYACNLSFLIWICEFFKLKSDFYLRTVTWPYIQNGVEFHQESIGEKSTYVLRPCLNVVIIQCVWLVSWKHRWRFWFFWITLSERFYTLT